MGREKKFSSESGLIHLSNFIRHLPCVPPCNMLEPESLAELTLELEEYLDQEICRTAPLSEAPEDSGAIDSSIRTAAA